MLYVGGNLIPPCISSFFHREYPLCAISFCFVNMDYSQRHQATMDEVRPTFGINVDDAMTIPNFSLMERYFVIGGKDPNMFYKNILKIIYPANRKQTVNPVSLLKKEIESRKQLLEGKEDSEGIFGLLKETITENQDVMGNWFERTEENCGAINLPKTSTELYELMKTRHLNFFESIIQANIRKEAEAIPLAAFEFWAEKEIKKAFEKELQKFLYNDPSSQIEGYEKGIIMLMIAMIRLKKEIDLMPVHQNREDFFDRKLINLIKMPIEDQREHLIYEQEDILISLNLIDDYILSFIRKDVENDEFEVETRFYRSRKNIIRTYKVLQVLVERKFELFMNFILFRNVISKFWDEEMNCEVIRMLIRAGMVIVNIRIWKDFILARDSGLIPTGRVVCRPISSKPIPEYYGHNISSGSASKNISEDKAVKKATFLEAIKSHEVIDLISDSEKETSEQKLGEDVSWKQRSPKKSSKYNPEEPDFIKKQLASEGWLTKRSPTDWLNIPDAIEPFRKEMSLKNAWSFERSNQHEVASMSTVNPYLTKTSSHSVPNSSIQVANPISAIRSVELGSGKDLRPRAMQEALSKLQSFIFEINFQS